MARPHPCHAIAATPAPSKLMATLVDQKRMPSPTTPPMPIADPCGDFVRDLPAFNYDEDDDATFDAWIKRYGPVIDDRGSTLSEERKRNLIVESLIEQRTRRTQNTSFR
ncbi:hypothetical protein ANCDUO_03667 [Ancylostoma duodenale]|uniref:DUF7083 domain-containing protein n=1 Tax=Ancylostoma duodenale TaxID=51022 RepID=A0A0C2D8G4_9BILA|nr:hypothetical protein ANCDUO_03667 [Ancylostoma duodenale]